MGKRLINVGTLGCLLGILGIFFPFTIRTADNLVLSYSQYANTSWIIVLFLNIFILVLVFRQEFHLVGMLIFLSIFLITKDVLIFLPRPKITFAWGFYLISGSQIAVLLFSILKTRGKKTPQKTEN
ncbi:hypothetical protein HYY75_04200 [bacterium]|nr:hypothetical protein [bacterium]